jgi:hypothetical protein
VPFLMSLPLPRLLSAILVLSPFLVCSALAQVPLSNLNGIATDPNNAVVVGARVTASNTSQGISRTTVTNGSGLYTLSDLPAGTWDLRVDQSGFAPSEYKNVVLEAGKATTIDVRFRMAQSGTTVQVDASGAGTVDLTQSMIQGQITSKTIQSLPLNGRNFLELAYLIPGNRPAPTFDPTKTNTLEVSSAGSFGRGGNITVDGGDNNDEVVGGTLARSSRLRQDGSPQRWGARATASSTSLRNREPTNTTVRPSCSSATATSRLVPLRSIVPCQPRASIASRWAARLAGQS